MSKVKFKLNRRGVRNLMMSNSMLGVLEQYANRIQLGAGDGYEKKRINSRWLVGAQSEAAKQDNFENNTLLKQTRKK